MEHIEFKIPVEYNALTRTAQMLTNLARDIAPDLGIRETATDGLAYEQQQGETKRTETSSAVTETVRVGDVEKTIIMENKEAAGQTVTQRTTDMYNDATGALTETDDGISWTARTAAGQALMETDDAADTHTAAQPTRLEPDTAPPPPPPAGVDLADGIPWDARIHAKTRTTLKTSPFGWKRKRGVDSGLVVRVEEELRKAVALPPVSAPETTPANDAAAAFGAGTDTTAGTDTAPTGEPITNFVELCKAVTAAGITMETRDAALASVGLASWPLLGARADMIPAVVAFLFPDGA